MNDGVIAFCALIGFSALILGGLFLTEKYGCEYRWAASGLKTDWGLLKGCLVQRKDGTWVPEKMLRDFDQ